MGAEMRHTPQIFSIMILTRNNWKETKKLWQCIKSCRVLTKLMSLS